MRPVRRPSHRPLLLQEPDLFELLWQADGGALDVLRIPAIVNIQIARS
jgi:hypothetical protein